ncbi:hypothetical protein M405DRAFT_870180 [Rhizopogon salebrosus TDB-379]|nr:hypothetical protein M405DRAFT_870180 [Rhizopogon salebrosus TDB-379]
MKTGEIRFSHNNTVNGINAAACLTNKRQNEPPPIRPACSSPALASMSSSPSLTPIDPMVVDDSLVTDDPGEVTRHHHHPCSSHGYSSTSGNHFEVAFCLNLLSYGMKQTAIQPMGSLGPWVHLSQSLGPWTTWEDHCKGHSYVPF